MQISYNVTPMTRSKEDINYIVIHDTGNKDSGANAEMHFRYFNTGNRNASADVFVDDIQPLKVNDWYKYKTWHCGDNYYGYKHPECRNSNSIGIEICVNRDTKKAIANTVTYVKKVMKELNIDIDHVIRHYDVTHKMCPGTIPMVDSSPSVNQNWIAFKKALVTSTIQLTNTNVVSVLREKYGIASVEWRIAKLFGDRVDEVYKMLLDNPEIINKLKNAGDIASVEWLLAITLKDKGTINNVDYWYKGFINKNLSQGDLDYLEGKV